MATLVVFLAFHPVHGVSANVPVDLCASANGTPAATPVACDWPGYFAAIGEWLTDPERAPARFAISDPEPVIDSPFVPDGWEVGATYRVEQINGGGANWITLLIYASEDTAAEAAGTLFDELTAVFWMEESGRGLEDGDICLSLVREESARSLCIAQRGDALIVGYSFLEIDASDWTIIYAAELTRRLIDAHEAVA